MTLLQTAGHSPWTYFKPPGTPRELTSNHRPLPVDLLQTTGRPPLTHTCRKPTSNLSTSNLCEPASNYFYFELTSNNCEPPRHYFYFELTSNCKHVQLVNNLRTWYEQLVNYLRAAFEQLTNLLRTPCEQLAKNL